MQLTSNNTTVPNGTHASREDDSIWRMPILAKLLMGFIYSVIMVVGTSGNVSVIYILCRKSKKRRHGHKLIIALAATDFISSIVMPFVMINDLVSDLKWYLGEFCCVVFPAMNCVFLFASAWTLVLISWERLR